MRKEIWQINSSFWCPIAGYCLNIAEQRKITSKFLTQNELKRLGSELHDFIIGSMSSKNPMSEYIQMYLDDKFEDKIVRYNQRKNEMTIVDYKVYLNGEDFGSLIWYLAAYKDLNRTDLIWCNSEIHRFTHEIYHELGDAYKVIQQQRNGDSIELQIEIDKLNEALDKKERQLAELKEKYAKISKYNNRQTSSILGLEKDLEQFIDSVRSQNARCFQCEKFGLCQKKVLLVGSITKLRYLYRKLVNEMGGQLFFYDNEAKSNVNQLQELIRKVDVVICPEDVNSESDCIQVKHNCSAIGADFYKLPKSDISTVYKTLQQISDDILD